MVADESKKKLSFVFLLIGIILITTIQSQTINNSLIRSYGLNSRINIGDYNVNFDYLDVQSNYILFYNLSYTSPCSTAQFYSIFNYTETDTNITLPCIGINLTNPENNSNATSYSNNFTANITGVELGIKNATLNIYNSSNDLVNQTILSVIGTPTSAIVSAVVTLVDEIYHWFISIFDTQDNKHTSTNSTLTIAIPPVITIYEPEPIYYSSKFNIELNYSIEDNGVGINRSLYNVVNSTGQIIIANTTLPDWNGTTTFNVPRDDIYNITLWSIDNKNNSNYTTVEFGVYSLGPVIHLQKPEDNSWTTNHSVNFTFTITDLNPISICTIYTNYTGDWNPFYTFHPPITNNGTMSIVRTVTNNGFYQYNVWCIDSAGLNNFALNNFNFGVDNVNPSLTIHSPNSTITNLTIPYNISVSDDVSLHTIRYWVTRGASLEVANTTITQTNGTFLVSSDLTTYTFHLFANDSAGNSNYTSTTFTTKTTSDVPGGGGGGAVAGKKETTDFQILSTNYLNFLDISLAKDSVRPRTRDFIIVNRGLTSTNINLQCEDTTANRTINICDYLQFEKTELTISSNEQDPTRTYFRLSTPENASLGDEYFFNIYAVSGDGFNKLSVSSRVSLFAYIYKWSYVPFTGKNYDYPVWTVSLFLASVTFGLSFWIFSKFKKEVVGFFISVILFLFVFFLTLIYL